MPPALLTTDVSPTPSFLYWSSNIVDIDPIELSNYGKKIEPVSNVIYWSYDFVDIPDDELFKFSKCK